MRVDFGLKVSSMWFTSAPHWTPKWATPSCVRYRYFQSHDVSWAHIQKKYFKLLIQRFVATCPCLLKFSANSLRKKYRCSSFPTKRPALFATSKLQRCMIYKEITLNYSVFFSTRFFSNDCNHHQSARLHRASIFPSRCIVLMETHHNECNS